MARSNSAQDALNTINILIGLNVLAHMFRDDLSSQLKLNKESYRIFDGNIQSMFVSMFYHMEPAHLAINMLALYQYANELFVNSSSKKWRSLSMVIFAYLACGVISFIGVQQLSSNHQRQWTTKLNNAGDSINEGFGTDVTSFFSNLWSEMTNSLPFADVLSSVYHFQLVRRIGASGVIYGFWGMRLITSLFSAYHSRMSSWDYFFAVGILAHDLSKCPLTWDKINMSTFLEGDGIDHAARFGAAIGGMMLALCIMIWVRVSSVRSWRGDGIRLGERWEDEQRRAELDQQRRERSRLLNNQSSSLGNNRQRSRAAL